MQTGSCSGARGLAVTAGLALQLSCPHVLSIALRLSLMLWRCCLQRQILSLRPYLDERLRMLMFASHLPQSDVPSSLCFQRTTWPRQPVLSLVSSPLLASSTTQSSASSSSSSAARLEKTSRQVS